MRFILKNEMGQHIKHKGQVSKGDTVICSVTYFKVIELKGDMGRVGYSHHNGRLTYIIEFKKGKGWFLLA